MYWLDGSSKLPFVPCCSYLMSSSRAKKFALAQDLIENQARIVKSLVKIGDFDHWSRCKLNHPKQRGSNFILLGFHQYFVFSCLIRNSTVMGTPDLESTQKGAPGDAQIVHFG
jgi:hypothetical protein